MHGFPEGGLRLLQLRSDRTRCFMDVPPNPFMPSRLSLCQPTRERRRKIFRMLIILGLALLFLLFFLILPRPLFRDDTSTVLLDRQGLLLGAKISGDQQWRFPDRDSIPEKFKQAILHYEDRYFYYHPGINPLAITRAVYLNVKYHKIVSGGSTLSMQVIRLARKKKDRTLFQKALETLLAFRLEFTYNKQEILSLYCSHAPFGGNIVGLEAASWRYFGVDPGNLSWAEAATLAVLPNSPGLIYPGRNPGQLLTKRNGLLDKLYQQGIIDASTCTLAKSESLPVKPYPIPQWAPHLLDRAVKEGHKGEKSVTTIDRALQERVVNILEINSQRMKSNFIYNAAALIVEVRTGNVLAYCGNLQHGSGKEHGHQVDLIVAPRSTGSILKPFLYAAMLNDGLLLPNTLVPDIPTQIGGFVPENYNLTYDGAVAAKMALSRSLNIPAVKMLQTYGYEQFYALLRNLGMRTLTRPAGHYGLALILGGAEATLWDLAGIYASMARTLNRFNNDMTCSKSDFFAPKYINSASGIRMTGGDLDSWLDPGSIWLTFEAMVEVSRPDEEEQWKHFSSSGKVAWKTGTSFGNRDAWSIGVTPEYVVAVWAGNASGEGRPGLTGVGTAAPVLFDIFKILPPTSWFSRPDSALEHIPVCHNSGHRPSTVCDVIDTIWVPKAGLKTPPCPYHQMVHLDKTGTWQVNSRCELPDEMQHMPWFILPPVEEWYFKSRNPFYKMLPPFRSDCAATDSRKNMAFIYPRNNSKVYIPVDLDGKPESIVVKVAHRDLSSRVFWDVDGRFSGSTSAPHQMTLAPEPGWHRLTLTGQNGEVISIKFFVIQKKDDQRDQRKL